MASRAERGSGVLRGLARVGVLSVLGLVLSGCAQDMFRVEVGGVELPEGTPVSVEVESVRANVRIMTDANVGSPLIDARAPGAKRGAANMPADVAFTRAELEQTEEGYVLRVRVDEPEGRDRGSGASSVRLRVPGVRDVRVRNNGGYVYVSGVQGAIDIRNGVDGPGGDVRVRTDAPLNTSITMVTTEGQVTLSLPPNAQGTLEVNAPRGKPTIYAPTLALDAFRPQLADRVWLAILNGGENRVLLRTAQGDARINIVKSPMRTSFRQPFFETAPD